MIPIQESTSHSELGIAKMKSFQQFIQESVNIQHVDTVIVNNAESSPASVGEEFSADIVYQGSIHRLTIVSENGIPSKNELADYLQGDYPGVIVQQIYVEDNSPKAFKIKDEKRYHPAKLDWV